VYVRVIQGGEKWKKGIFTGERETTMRNYMANPLPMPSLRQIGLKEGRCCPIKEDDGFVKARSVPAACSPAGAENNPSFMHLGPGRKG